MEPFCPIRPPPVEQSRMDLLLGLECSSHSLDMSLAQGLLLIPLYRVRTVMENLGKSWKFKMVISRPGKVMEKT